MSVQHRANRPDRSAGHIIWGQHIMTIHLPALRARLPRILVLTAIGLMCGGGIAQATTEEVTAPPEFSCAQGEFCSWEGEHYDGTTQRMDLRTANPEECLTLPEQIDARSFANRTDRHVTVYQDADCSTEGDFSTYPGGGTYVPQAPYVVRGIQIWN